MQAFGVPRVDAGAEGIHLVWTWPHVLPLSEGGYDIQRLGGEDERWEPHCETIDPAIIAYLRARREYPAPLGPLRLRTGARFATITDAQLFPLDDAGSHFLGVEANAKQASFNASLSSMLASSPIAASSVATEFDVFIQELTQSVERASVQVTGR